MAFKSFNDSNRRQALIPFLEAANELEGVLVTLAIRKSIRNLCHAETILEVGHPRFELDPKWKVFQFDKMLRVVHLVAVMIGHLSRPYQDVVWVSDQDEMFANERKSRDLASFLSSFSGHYVDHPLGFLGVGTTAIDEEDLRDEDFNAIPDIAAGSVAEMVSLLSRACGGFIPSNVAIPVFDAPSKKSDIIYSWLNDGTKKLKRTVIVFENQPSGGISVFRLDMSD